MDNKTFTGPCWSTSCFDGANDTRPGDPAALGWHLSSCRRSGGRLAQLQFGARAVHGFVASRLVTTVAVVALVVGLVAALS
ncbi:hypothetical protein [Ideonella sp. A 288]|uniref:hypothetical protein n=1 Tax=Ideonella sp. A 288 TaxID=1962181 RepID=UPI000B4AA292|nr:hypothetical protein [Ideonella sp. A 288]